MYATLQGSGDHAVVLAHGARFDKESWSKQAKTLSANGFKVLALDFRGYGNSRGGEKAGARPNLYLDVLAAVDYLHSNGAQRVSLIGGSMGGGAVAQAAAEAMIGDIDRIILLAGTPIANPEKMSGHKLFIVSRGDARGGGILRLPGIRDQYERATSPKELIILEGSAHAQLIFDSDQSERLMEEIIRFLSLD